MSIDQSSGDRGPGYMDLWPSPQRRDGPMIVTPKATMYSGPPQ